MSPYKALFVIAMLGVSGLICYDFDGKDRVSQYVIGACLAAASYCVGRLHEISQQEKEHKWLSSKR